MVDQTVRQPEILSVSDVQSRLGLSRNCVYEAIARNEIPSLRVGRRILIPRKAFEQMLDGTTRATPK